MNYCIVILVHIPYSLFNHYCIYSCEFDARNVDICTKVNKHHPFICWTE